MLNIVGFIFMVPFGLGSAAAVRVGQAVGRRDPDGCARGRLDGARAGRRDDGAVRPCCSRLRRDRCSSAFTSDTAVLEVGVGLFLVAAVFQLFDGVQAVTTGALRGLGNTQTPMFVNLVGHWVIGLPIA